MSRVLKVTREAFGVKAFAEVDGQLHGLLDNEVFRLIMDFGEFCHSVKKNTLNAPTSSPPTDTSDDQSTTNVS